MQLDYVYMNFNLISFIVESYPMIIRNVTLSLGVRTSSSGPCRQDLPPSLPPKPSYSTCMHATL